MADSTAKFLLFADLHLDRAFAWLRDKPEAARKLRNGLRDTLARITDLARQHEVDALLCAGDLYEQELYSPDTSAFIRKTFADLMGPDVAPRKRWIQANARNVKELDV